MQVRPPTAEFRADIAERIREHARGARPIGNEPVDLPRIVVLPRPQLQAALMPEIEEEDA